MTDITIEERRSIAEDRYLSGLSLAQCARMLDITNAQCGRAARAYVEQRYPSQYQALRAATTPEERRIAREAIRDAMSDDEECPWHPSERRKACPGCAASCGVEAPHV